MNKNIIVKESPIHEKGVFAGRDYLKGEVILVWDLQHPMTEQQFRRLSEEEKQYVTQQNGKFIEQQSPTKFINHSCEPNTKAKNFSTVATRNIQAGEEITSDYRIDAGIPMDFQCNCKNTACAGRITTTQNLFI